MDILVTGSIAYDEIMDFPGEFKNHFHPERLHQINVSFVVNRLEKQLGGTATNIAYNVHLSNIYLNSKSNIFVLSSVGRDGHDFVSFFKKNNINAKGVLIDKKLYTATGKVITDKVDNQIWGFYYGASASAKRIVVKRYLNKSSWIIISATHSDSFLHFQSEAIKSKSKYIYDPGMTLTWIKDRDLKTGVLNASVIIGNDYEVAMILKRLKKTVKQLVDKGIVIITTLGEHGVRYESKNEKLEVPGYNVKSVIDPTGAGDAWRGGFIAALSSGRSVRESLKLGNVMASFAIEKYGTVNHSPTKQAIEKRLKSL